MVQPPYQVAARIFGAAADPITRARISGAYTLGTGRDIEDLPPHLYLDVVEAWHWEHFTTEKQIDAWQQYLSRPAPIDWVEEAHRIVYTGVALLIGRFIRSLNLAEGTGTDLAPPGWSDDELLAEAVRITGGQLIE